MHPGSLADIKSGLPVTIEPSLDGKSAISITVLPSDKPEAEEKRGL
jgi:hypothetical protein